MLQFLHLTFPELYQTYTCKLPFPSPVFPLFFFFHFYSVYTAIMTVPQSMCFPSSHKSLCYPSFLLCSSSDCHHSPRAAG